jgi:hypothetical protein
MPGVRPFRVHRRVEPAQIGHGAVHEEGTLAFRAAARLQVLQPSAGAFADAADAGDLRRAALGR